MVPDCVSEDTQKADYHVVASIVYRANGAVAPPCLGLYSGLMSHYYAQLNEILTQRCSAINVQQNVSLIRTEPILLRENIVQVKNHLKTMKLLRG